MDRNGKIIYFNTFIPCLHPCCFDDANEIAGYLINHQAVEVHFNQLDHTDACRMLDFLSGVIYALDGDIILISSECVYFSTDKIHTEMIQQKQPEAHLLSQSTHISSFFLC